MIEPDEDERGGEGEPRDLRTEIEAERIAEALDALPQAPGVIDVAPFGNAIHVLVDDAARAEQALPAWLAARGIPQARVARIEPSLEDTFVELVSHRSPAPLAAS